jgi:hypothetical protein
VIADVRGRVHDRLGAAAEVGEGALGLEIAVDEAHPELAEAGGVGAAGIAHQAGDFVALGDRDLGQPEADAARDPGDR